MNKRQKEILIEYIKKHKEYKYGDRINDISDVYKGDGINNCKWCGNTGFMRTFSFLIFYNDAPCVCKIGSLLLRYMMELENENSPRNA